MSLSNRALTSSWALSFVTDPVRAERAGINRQRRAWAVLMAMRGKTCRYPYLPPPRITFHGGPGSAA